MSKGELETAEMTLKRYRISSAISVEARDMLTALYSGLAETVAVAESPIDWQGRFVAGESRFEPLARATANRLGVERTREAIGGVDVIRLRPATFDPEGPLMVYVHGGAYTAFSAESTLMIPALLATQSGCEVISVDYTRAPQAQWQQASDQIIAVWRALLDQGINPRRVGLLGDSAGGGLAAGSVLKMRDTGLSMPGALYLISPWSDITATGDSVQTMAEFDPILSSDMLTESANAYADTADQKHPYVSPVYGDYTKPFPPTLIQVGTRELFLSHAVRHYQAILGGGTNEAVLDVYEGMPHVHLGLLPFVPETKVAIERACRFLLRHLNA